VAGSPDNPFFAKAMANRLGLLLGKGIDPWTTFTRGNPPSNPERVDALTAEFSRRLRLEEVDARHLRSRTAAFHCGNSGMRTTPSTSATQSRRLSAEQMVDALAMATGTVTLAGVPSDAGP
jgi:hypothetical protein